MLHTIKYLRVWTPYAEMQGAFFVSIRVLCVDLVLNGYTSYVKPL